MYNALSFIDTIINYVTVNLTHAQFILSMMIKTVPFITTISRFVPWLIGVFFVLFQFFLQLSSGVVIGSIMQEMNLSAMTAGLLSSAFYFVYTALQIPVGVLFDNQSARLLLAANALLCAIGCLLFAKSSGLTGLFIGRIMMGSGSAFAFVGLSHLLRQHYSIKRFAFMIGLSETLGFIGTALGLVGMGAFILHCGWRGFIEYAAIVGAFIAFLCWKFIPDADAEINSKPSSPDPHPLLTILTNGTLWINGLFVGLSFTVVTVFGALWAEPFIQTKMACTLQQSTFIIAAFFLGTAVSCPLFGILTTYVRSRKLLILESCFSTACLVLMDLYFPTTSTMLMTWLMFLTGICCGAYMLAYSISNELAPQYLQSTAAGFTNTLAVLSTPFLQTLVGYLLDLFNQGSKTLLLSSYQQALLIIPGSLIISGLLALFLPEKTAYKD